jgi:hypothetical protein
LTFVGSESAARVCFTYSNIIVNMCVHSALVGLLSEKPHLAEKTSVTLLEEWLIHSKYIQPYLGCINDGCKEFSLSHGDVQVVFNSMDISSVARFFKIMPITCISLVCSKMWQIKPRFRLNLVL